MNDSKNNVFTFKRSGDNFSVKLIEPYQEMLERPNVNYPVYICENDKGHVVTVREAIKNYESRLMDEQMRTQPSKKLLREYHFKDSLHHIVANNIIASPGEVMLYALIILSGIFFVLNFLTFDYMNTSEKPLIKKIKI